MKYIYMIVISMFLLGCAGVKKGDYVTYTSNDYLFIHDGFINRSIDCLELGKMKQGGLELKYCVGRNYASALVQGFIFEHSYKSFEERFVGSTLSFKAKHPFTIQCSSETVDDAPSGKEYINCMIPQRNFDLYLFIEGSKEDIDGQFRAAVGDKEVFHGVIDSRGKALLKTFYKELRSKNEKNWKSREL
jgi:hypothetical protein